VPEVEYYVSSEIAISRWNGEWRQGPFTKPPADEDDLPPVGEVVVDLPDNPNMPILPTAVPGVHINWHLGADRINDGLTVGEGSDSPEGTRLAFRASHRYRVSGAIADEVKKAFPTRAWVKKVVIPDPPPPPPPTVFPSLNDLIARVEALEAQIAKAPRRPGAA
jgi:hypothetical protein